MSRKARPSLRFADVVRRPGRTVALLCLLQIGFWGLVPILAHSAPPLDVVEGYQWGRAGVVATFKHPNLPGLLLEASRRLSRGSIWPAYLLAQLFVTGTFLCVYRLGEELLGGARALAGTLLLTGLYYFSWPTPELNHNLAQLPLWTLVVLSLWRATSGGGLRWWLALGAAGGLVVWCKYSSLLLIVTCGLWFVVDRRARRRLLEPGPWLALAALAAVASPQVHYLFASDFLPFDNAWARATSQEADSWLSFLAAQLLAHAPLLLIAGAAGVVGPGAVGGRRKLRRERLFLSLFGLAPTVLLCLVSPALHIGLKDMWGAPMYGLSGLLLVAWLPGRVDGAVVRRIAVAAAALLVMLPLGYGATAVSRAQWSERPGRVNWPQQEIATRLVERFEGETWAPLRIVAGPEWEAGLVALTAPDRPAVMIEGSRRKAPWVDDEDLSRFGFLAVWSQRLGPSESLRALLREHDVDPDRWRSLRLPWSPRPEAEAILLGYAIAPPETVPPETVPPVTVSPERTPEEHRGGSPLSLQSESGALVEVEPDPFRLRLRDEQGGVVAEGISGSIRFRQARTAYRVRSVVDSKRVGERLELEVDTGAGRGRLSLYWRSPLTLALELEPPRRSLVTEICDRYSLRPGESIYGLSERPVDSISFGRKPPLRELMPNAAGTLDRRGERVEMYVRPTMALYAPFFHSSRGYGAMVDTSFPGSFDVGRADRRVLSFCFETSRRAPSPLYRVYFFVGDHRQITDEYTALTGRPFVPPDWAFKHWRWRDELSGGAVAELDGYEIQAEVAEDLRMYDRFDIPAGVYLIDRPWSAGDYGFETFRWDDARFPSKEEMFAALDRRGWDLALWSAALLVGDNFEEARRLGFVAPGSDRILDLTQPQAREWWIERHVPFLRRWKVRGIKLDRGDEHVPSRSADRWFDGRSGRQMHNAFPTEQASLYAEILQRAWDDDYGYAVKVRAGWTGTQRYAMAWGGDSTATHYRGRGPSTDLGLRGALVSLQRAAFLGYAVWGSDTGGYFPFSDREVFARWIELSSFCPLMEIGGMGSNAPWDMPREPRFDEEMIDIYRRYVQLHHALIPYLSEQGKIAAATGLPIARPLVFDYPSDLETRDLWDQFLLGPDLIVAPVWRSGQRRREVYLPEGEWLDFWGQDPSRIGPISFELDAPLDHIPVFLRAGASPTLETALDEVDAGIPPVAPGASR